MIPHAKHAVRPSKSSVLFLLLAVLTLTAGGSRIEPVFAADDVPSGEPSASDTGTGGHLTLAEALAASLQHFPTVRGARAETEGAEANLDLEQARWVPNLSLRGSANRYQEPTVVYPIHGFGPNEIPPFSHSVFQGGVFLDYTLFDGGGRINRVRQARDHMEATRAAETGSESALLAQVTATYLQTLSRREALAAHDRRLEALRAERDRVLKFEEAGKAARVEKLRVEAALAGAEAERVRMASALAASQRDLTGLTGIRPPRTDANNLAAVALADTAIAPGDTLVARAFASNPGVREAERASAAARSAGGVARSARYPRLQLTGGYQVWSDPDGNSSNEWNVGVALNQTLFTGGEVNARIHEADAAGRRAEEGLRLARISTRRAVLDAADGVREADTRVQSLVAAVTRYEEVARIEALALKAGTGTQTDFLTAEADLLNARASLAEAHRAAIVARVDLARLSGVLDRNWLAQNLESQP